VLAGLLSAAMVLVGPSDDAPAQVADRRVYVIGDSVLLGAQAEVTVALRDWDVTVDAQQSLSLLGATSMLEARRPEIGGVAVVELGLNDGTGSAEFRRRIDAAMSVLTGVPTVVWLTQREFEAGRAEMNAELVAATTRYPSLRVLDWNAVVTNDPAVVGPDGIHLSPAGRAVIADLIRTTVESVTTPTTTSVTTPPSTAAPETTARSKHVKGRGRARPGPAALTSDGCPLSCPPHELRRR
jgi:lysophospholipase L1-like esterase